MHNSQTTRPYNAQPTQLAETDEALALQVGQSSEAFAELYRRHTKRIYRFHLFRTGSVDDAEDLTSQTFLAALENIASFRGRGSFCGWLFGIASHKVADHYRRRRSDRPLEQAETAQQADPSPEDTATTRLQLVQVCEALQMLAPEQVEALNLRIFGELSAAEAGQVMGKSEAAVKMLVHRGLRKLQERLTPSQEVLQ